MMKEAKGLSSSDELSKRKRKKTVAKRIAVILGIYFVVLIYYYAGELKLIVAGSTSTKIPKHMTTGWINTIQSTLRGSNVIVNSDDTSANLSNGSIPSDFRTTGAETPGHDGIRAMIARVLEVRSDTERRVREEYGDYFDLFFQHHAKAAMFGTKSEESRRRVHRRMVRKVLEAKMGPTTTSTNVVVDPTFVWATGGHSAAAAHGNLLNQSYTAVLEDTCAEAFAAVGLRFEARNYAMGGYKSGPELASCQTSVFGVGEDVDLLYWDFGMTDGTRNPGHMILWSHRAVTTTFFNSPKEDGGEIENAPPPPLLAFDYIHDNVRTSLESNGATVIVHNTDRQQTLMKENLPDFENYVGDNGTTVPRGVRYLMCGGWAENKITPCIEDKWDTSRYCKSAKYQVAWHAGWKSHMFRGRMFGFYLIDVLLESLYSFLSGDEANSTLSSTAVDEHNTNHSDTNSSPKPGMTLEYLRHLQELDRLDRERFRASPVPTGKYGSLQGWDPEFNLTDFYRGTSACHTALLPSRSRYGGSSSSYDLGYPSNSLPSGRPSNEEGQMMLVYDPNERQKCAVPLQIDYKDYFLIRHGDGSVSYSLPTEEEAKTVWGGSEPAPVHNNTNSSLSSQAANGAGYGGMIMLCQPNCPWNKCPKHSVQLKDPTTGKLTVRVDGTEVSSFVNVEDYCFFLRRTDGSYSWGGPRKQHELQFELHTPGTDFQVSSIILW